MCTSWNQIDGIFYYFNPDGSMKTGWVNDGTHKYYMEEAAGDNHGKMSFGFKKIAGTTYFFNEQGHMVKGWLKSNDKYYYFDEEGKIVAGKTITIEGKEYTFDTHGVCTNLSGTPSSVTNAIPGILKAEATKGTKSSSENQSKSTSSGQPSVVPAPGDNKSTESKPAETKSGESKPSESKPGESKKAEAKPSETKSGESKNTSTSATEPTVPAAPTDETKSNSPSGEAKPKSPADETKKGNGSTSKDEVGLKPGETSGPK